MCARCLGTLSSWSAYWDYHHGDNHSWYQSTCMREGLQITWYGFLHEPIMHMDATFVERYARHCVWTGWWCCRAVAHLPLFFLFIWRCDASRLSIVMHRTMAQKNVSLSSCASVPLWQLELFERTHIQKCVVHQVTTVPCWFNVQCTYVSVAVRKAAVKKDSGTEVLKSPTALSQYAIQTSRIQLRPTKTSCVLWR